MSQTTPTDLVTGAFSYSGAAIAQRLLDAGRQVRTLTYHCDRPHHLQGRVEASRYRFDDPAALARSLAGVNTLYNTFWGASTTGARASQARSRPPGCCSMPRRAPGCSASFT